MEAVQSWSYEDFLTYLLLLGASADLMISEEEKQQIEDRVGQENFTRIKRCFDRQNDAQRIETVSELYDKYKAQIGGKENLAKTLRDIFVVDTGKENVMDRYLLMMLKRIL